METAPPRFCRYFTWARDLSFFNFTRRPDFVAILREPVIFDFFGEAMEAFFVDFMRDHVHISDFRKNGKA